MGCGNYFFLASKRAWVKCWKNWHWHWYVKWWGEKKKRRKTKKKKKQFYNAHKDGMWAEGGCLVTHHKTWLPISLPLSLYPSGVIKTLCSVEKKKKSSNIHFSLKAKERMHGPHSACIISRELFPQDKAGTSGFSVGHIIFHHTWQNLKQILLNGQYMTKLKITIIFRWIKHATPLASQWSHHIHMLQDKSLLINWVRLSYLFASKY